MRTPTSRFPALRLAALGLAALTACADDPADDDPLGETAQTLRSAGLQPPEPYELANITNTLLAQRATATGARVVPGDYNGDGRIDLAILGAAGTSAVTFGMARGDGSFEAFVKVAPDVASWAATTRAQIVAADLDRDGHDELVLAGGTGWTTVRVAYLDGAGALIGTQRAAPNVPRWANTAGTRLRAGDVDGDGRDELIIIGGPGWTTVPVAYARADGSFRETNERSDLATLARDPAVQIAIGDFDGNGLADIALAGGASWTTVPLGMSTGDGRFDLLDVAVTSFPGWARVAGAQLRAGDSDGDGRDDLLLVGGQGWGSIPAALARQQATTLTFAIENVGAADLASWAATTHVTAIVGEQNQDRFADVILVGGNGWSGVRTGTRQRLPFALPPGDAERGVRTPAVTTTCGPSNVSAALRTLCEQLPGCNFGEPKCTTMERELAAGATIYPTGTWWGGLGSHGDDLANAALCLLKELDVAPRHRHAEAGETSATQQIGFKSYDPVARTVVGYQMIEMCAPIIGCIGMPPQTFTASVRRSAPANPSGSMAGDMPLRAAYGLDVVTDRRIHHASFAGPPIMILTPWGVMQIEPRLTYDSWYEPIENPTGTVVSTTYAPEEIPFRHDYGRMPAVATIDAVERGGWPAGWWSQLSLGGRGADRDAIVSAGAIDRADLDLTRPRWSKEKQPTHLLTAGGALTIPVGLPSWMNEGPVSATLAITIDLTVTSRAAGQLAIALSEGAHSDPDNTFRESRVDLAYGVSAAQNVDVTLSFDLHIAFAVPFVDPIDLHGELPIPLDDAGGADHDIGEAGARLSAHGAGPGFYDGIDTLAGAHLDEAASGPYVGACLASPREDRPLPVDRFVPAEEVFAIETPYPCNICVGIPANDVGVPTRRTRVCPDGVACPVTAMTSAASGAWDCDVATLGCFDVCTGTTSPKVMRTAAQIEPDRCKQIPK